MAKKQPAAPAVNLDQLSKEQFQSVLRQAVVEAGQRVGKASSVWELSVHLTNEDGSHPHPRRIQDWLAGKGPSYPNMQRLYVKLVDFPNNK